MKAKLKPGASLLLACAILVAIAAFLVSSCGADEISTGLPSPSPSPAPAWLSEKAELLAEHWGDPHPTAAYWGLLSDPEIGRLTSAGPRDPSRKAYAIILVGDYSKMYTQVHWPSPPSSPLPSIRWIYSLFTTAHEDAGSFGYGINDFEATQYPSLQPLKMPPSPEISQMATPIPHAETFTSGEPHFAVTYDANRLQALADPSNSMDAGPHGLLTVSFVDRNPEDRPFPFTAQGGMEVLVRRLAIPGKATPPPLAAMRPVLAGGDLGDPDTPGFLHGGLKGMKVGAIQTVTLNGLRGYRASYAWDRGRSVCYVLYRGRYVYRLEATAATKVWPSIWPTLDASLHSLTVTP